MKEGRYSRHTREKTWFALHSQIENTPYVIVPYSMTTNSVSLLKIRESKGETRLQVQALAQRYEQAMEAFLSGQAKERPTLPREETKAVVLARSSDYYHYHLETRAQFDLIVCGLHDAYCLLPVLEMRTNMRYSPGQTSYDMKSPDFERVRKSEYGHNIFVTALVKGDQGALSFLKTLKPSTRNRIRREVSDLQHKVYHGRPLAFMTLEERMALGLKISEGMRRYHRKKRGT
jgi:hypothetical protein